MPPRSSARSDEDDASLLADTATGRRIKAFVEAVNSGRTDEVKQFVRVHYAPAALEGVSMKQRVGVYSTLFQQTQGIHLRHVQQTGADQILMLAQARKAGNWSSYQFDFDPAQDDKIVAVCIDPIHASEAARLMAA